jgi:hypothetical protein
MIFKQFKENNPISMIAIPIMVGLALLPSFFKATGFIKSSKYLLPFLEQDVPTYFHLTASGIIIVISALLIGVSFNRNAFFERNTFVAPVIFALLSVFSLRFHASPKIHLANLLLVLSIMQLFKLHSSDKWKGIAFNIGFLLGIAAILAPITIVVFLAFSISISTLKGFRFKEIVLYILGGLTPFLYAWTYQLWTEGHVDFYYFFNYHNASPYFSRVLWIEYTSYGLLVLLMIIGLISINLNRFNSIKFKEKSRAIVTILIISVIGMIVFKVLKVGSDQPILLIPFLTIVLTTAALTKKLSHITNLLFYIITGLFICSIFLS